MSKNKIKEKPQPKVAEPVISQPTKAGFKLIPVHFNLLFLLVFLIIFFKLKTQENSGYKWLSEEFVARNLEMIQKYPNLSEKEKGEMKLGFDFTYIDYVKTNTPENAIILFPPPSITLKDSTPDQPKFRITGGGIYTRLWDQYYLYPRKVVFASDSTNPLLSKITHVAVVNYWGYDKLKYNVAQKSRLGVYPLTIK